MDGIVEGEIAIIEVNVATDITSILIISVFETASDPISIEGPGLTVAIKLSG